MPEPGSEGPLAGLRVIDCSTVLAGPYCTMVLGDLGADIVKVEPPDGDPTRGWGPPWVGRREDGTETAAYYLAVNRNKRSIRLDLRSREGTEVLRRLLAEADALVENFRPGTLAGFGFDDAELARLAPDLVHLSISGYGSDGPGSTRPGYDFVIQAVGGLMSITGEPDGAPMKVGVAISDVATGLFGAVGVLAALLARDQGGRGGERDGRPRGQRVETSLLASTLAILVNQAQNAFVSGRSPGRRGNAHPNIVPYEAFDTADGRIALAVGSERQWVRLCEAIDRRGLATDARFATNGLRVEHREALRAILDERFRSRSTADWISRLDAADVPVGPINGVLEAFGQVEPGRLGATVDLEHPAIGSVRQPGIPFRLSATPASIRTAPPGPGEHTDQILAELGYDRGEVAQLRRGGVG
ncbi:MAG: CaiB/BaiF CoA transferase family protein [Chloroflexota bacterium]